MILGHVIALDPTYKQANRMARSAGCARFSYNWGLDEWRRQYKAGLKPKVGAIKKAFNAIKEVEFPWIYESPKDANQQAFSDLGCAFTNFFRWQRERTGPKVGYPTRRRKFVDDAFYVSNDKFRFHADEKRVYLPVIGSVRMHERLRLEGRVLSARVYRTAGLWYLAVQVDVLDARRPTAHVRPIVGVDLGIKTALVVSRGGPSDTSEPIDAPKPLKHALGALRRANRCLHRRKKGSKNRRKAAVKLARIHARVANVRKDFMHKVTTRLCRENQAIVIEDLNVSGMLRNHRLARAIADVGFGMFRSFMTYKAPIYGSELIVADRWFASSKRCHDCGNVKGELSLSERTYTCDVCGLVADRDENASLNLEAYPRLAGNTVLQDRTPTDDSPSTPWVRPRRKAVVEVGTKPCALVRTS
jgi:putative transposase